MSIYTIEERIERLEKGLEKLKEEINDQDENRVINALEDKINELDEKVEKIIKGD